MRPLASMADFKKPRVRTPVREWPVERILALPHTSALRAQLVRLRLDGAPDERRRAMQSMLEDALERDALYAELPSGCWCFGHGGTGDRALMLPGDEVPMVLTVYCDCAVGQARRVSDDDLRLNAHAFAQRIQIAGIWDGARVPERFANCTFATFPMTPDTAPAVAALGRWLDGDGWCIVLHGDYGVGKTGLAISALREAAERHHAGLFVKAPDLLARIRATYGRQSETSEADVLASLRSIEYLVLDDIGAEQATDWATSMLFQVLDHRHDDSAKTIITTNLNLTDLALHMSERTFHRFEEGTMFVRITGPNLRRSDRV